MRGLLKGEREEVSKVAADGSPARPGLWKSKETRFLFPVYMTRPCRGLIALGGSACDAISHAYLRGVWAYRRHLRRRARPRDIPRIFRHPVAL
jgi:hypothetical protein